MEKINEISRTPSSWTKEDNNLANTYLNIANIFPIVQNYMKSHVDNVKNGEGLITLGDIEEALKYLEEQINNRLRSSVSNKVTITLNAVPATTPRSALTQLQATQQVPPTNKPHNKKGKVRLSESLLRKVIRESVKKILREASFKTSKYFWSISQANNDWESNYVIEDSADSNDALSSSFPTPDAAYADGLRNLKMYNDNCYMLEVYYFTPSGSGEYVSGYLALNNHGKIQEV